MVNLIDRHLQKGGEHKVWNVVIITENMYIYYYGCKWGAVLISEIQTERVGVFFYLANWSLLACMTDNVEYSTFDSLASFGCGWFFFSKYLNDIDRFVWVQAKGKDIKNKTEFKQTSIIEYIKRTYYKKEKWKMKLNVRRVQIKLQYASLRQTCQQNEKRTSCNC